MCVFPSYKRGGQIKMAWNSKCDFLNAIINIKKGQSYTLTILIKIVRQIVNWSVSSSWIQDWRSYKGSHKNDLLNLWNFSALDIIIRHIYVTWFISWLSKNIIFVKLTWTFVIRFEYAHRLQEMTSDVKKNNNEHKFVRTSSRNQKKK